MERQVNEAAEQVEPIENAELTELGTVSEETRGGLIGHSLDGGFGVRKP